MRIVCGSPQSHKFGDVAGQDESHALLGKTFDLQPILKRLIDVLIASVMLVLLIPLLLSIAGLIRVGSSGPVFFRQVRMGRGGRDFRILKFRTMVTQAEQLLPGLESRNESPGGILFEMKDDPRVTTIGKFLRRTSLDELPQLVNVLLGQMSLVGPRPLQMRDCEKLAELDPVAFTNRLKLLPGLTGLAQISGRRGLDPGRILELDQEYIKNSSIGLDLAILWRTAFTVASRQGAY